MAASPEQVKRSIESIESIIRGPTGTVGARQMKRPKQGGIPLTKKSGYTKLDMRYMEARDGGLGWKIIFWVFAVSIPVGLISSICESITGS